MNILVTGSTGFLGRALVRRLAADGGYNIVATGRRKERGKVLEEELDGVQFVPCKLEDREALLELCVGVERLFHCGAFSSPWGSRLAFEEANVAGTENVIEGCRRSGVGRLIYVSSPSVYPQREALQMREDTMLAGRPLNHYIATKRRADKLVTKAASRGLDVITLRPRALFGPGDEALFPRLLRVNQMGRFPLIGFADPWMDCTYIDNAVDALILAAEAPIECSGNIYNITNGEPIRRSQLLETLFAEVGMPYSPRSIPFPVAYAMATLLEFGSRCFTFGRWEPPLTRYTVCALGRSQTLDITAARLELDFAPQVTVDEGIKRFGSWWRQQQLEGRDS